MRLIFSLLLLVGCTVQAAVPVQSFTDDLGRVVNVPLHPQRIVSLHDLDITIPLIELGVPPVASHGRTRPDGSHFLRSGVQLTGVDFDNSNITYIGTADIDIEAIVAAKPDLIITEPSRNTPIEQLEKIAPTVSIDHLDGGAPEIYRKLAQLTGTQNRLALLERRYREEIAQLKRTVDTQHISVAVIQANHGKINALHTYHSWGEFYAMLVSLSRNLSTVFRRVGALMSVRNVCLNWMPILSSRLGVAIPAVNRRMKSRRWMR